VDDFDYHGFYRAQHNSAPSYRVTGLSQNKFYSCFLFLIQARPGPSLVLHFLSRDPDIKFCDLDTLSTPPRDTLSCPPKTNRRTQTRQKTAGASQPRTVLNFSSKMTRNLACLWSDLKYYLLHWRRRGKHSKNIPTLLRLRMNSCHGVVEFTHQTHC